MHIRFAALTVLLGAVVAAAAEEPPGPKPPTSRATDDERAIYSVGVSLWRMLAPLGLSPAEVEVLERGLRDAQNGTPAVRPEDVAPKVAAFREARALRAAEEFKAASASYLEAAEKEPGAVKTPSGLVFFDLQPGVGASPRLSDVVKVHYRGTLVNGAEFDSSYALKEPARLPLSHVMPCWREALQMMKVGGKARLVCPAKLAYGEGGAPSRDRRKPSIPGGATLVFEVELFDIPKPPDLPAAPPSPPPPRPRP
jgi:FKBP-type peptidyl-prolyl cis-trans isomerase FkpA